MQQLPYTIFSFCLRLFDYQDDPELNTARIYLHSPSAATSPVRIKIHTNHLDYYSEIDFQFQFLMEPDQVQAWCSCIDLQSSSAKSFFYQYHISNGEIIEGNIAGVEDWIDENFKSGSFRELLCIQSSIPTWE